MPAIDWNQVLAFTVSPLELFVRGTLTYFFLFLLFRFVVRRDTGTLGLSDLLVLVIIAAASSGLRARRSDSPRVRLWAGCPSPVSASTLNDILRHFPSFYVDKCIRMI